MLPIASESTAHEFQMISYLFRDSGSSSHSHVGGPSPFKRADCQDPDLSYDGLLPEQPAFIGLFPPAIFRSLLFKAVNAAQLGPSSAGDAPSESSCEGLILCFLNPLSW